MRERLSTNVLLLPIRTLTSQHQLRGQKPCYEGPKVLCNGAYVITRYMKCFLKETGHSLQKCCQFSAVESKPFYRTDDHLKWKIPWIWSMGLTQVHSASHFSEQCINVPNNCQNINEDFPIGWSSSSVNEYLSANVGKDCTFIGLFSIRLFS